jgi:hypothetical protein
MSQVKSAVASYAAETDLIMHIYIGRYIAYDTCMLLIDVYGHLSAPLIVH